MANRDALAHLLRRATFGPTAAEVDEAERVGLDATIDRLLAPDGPDPGALKTPPPVLGPDPLATVGPRAPRADRQRANQRRGEQVRQLTLWWLTRMVQARHQLTEKLVFFWHGHWATSAQKVRSAQLMLGQLDTFRRYGPGPFGPLAAAMVRDPALILWLDGHRNTRVAPNENLARELMELFTVGIGSYTEADVKAGARALTGWLVQRGATRADFVPRRHDPGVKTILGRTAAFDAGTYAELLATRPETARHLASRLWFRFAGDGPPPPAVTTDVTAPAVTTIALLRTVLADPAFGSTRGTLVKQPVEWLVGAMRQLGVRPGALTDKQAKELLGGLSRMDQLPLRPPSVAGWPTGDAWLTTSSLQARMRLATVLAGLATPAIKQALAAAPVAGRPDALARLLVVDGWTERTRGALTPLAGNPDRLIAVGLISPEYTVS